MYVPELRPKAGLLWIRYGFRLFKATPLTFIVLFAAYFFGLSLLAALPYLGVLLPLLLIPGLSLGLVAICHYVIVQKSLNALVLVSGFFLYGREVALQLVLLGLIYCLFLNAIFFFATWYIGEFNPLLWVSGEVNQALHPRLFKSLLLILVAYIPLAMSFWFAPMLVVWHDFSAIKALFFSIAACWRNRIALFVFCSLWCAIVFVLLLLLQFPGISQWGRLLVVPCYLVLCAVFYCSRYTCYRACFGDEALDLKFSK